ncbi:MAG: DUF4143 domain-containing protein [Micrococcales bacterium]|nr:DUF4143 domain-containing protein [Micrococcales bacterium]
MEYQPRIIDVQLRRLLADVPAVAINGPKAVGKSYTASQFAAATINLDFPDERALTTQNPARLDRMDKPLLIDEWQHLPSIWDRVRRAVDSGAAPGSFMLTGSAAPAQGPLHTGAGRIVRLRLRPMSLAERQLVSPTVSLKRLLDGDRPEIGGTSSAGLEDYAEEITATGFPGIRANPTSSRDDVLDGYLELIVKRDFPESGHAVRRPAALLSWLRAFAAATSSITSYSRILDAATSGIANKPSRMATVAYRETLERLWLIDQVPAWEGRNHLSALTRSAKHHLADPGLAARLLGVSAEALLDKPNPDGLVLPRFGTLFGALFEGLATLCVRVYAQASSARISYLRTIKGSREVDLIASRPDGRIVPIEVKLASAVDNSDVAHLLWLRDAMPDSVVDMIVLTSGPEAYRRPDGVAVVPLALLGP